MRKILVVAILTILSITSFAGTVEDFLTKSNTFFQNNVKSGKVDYVAIKASNSINGLVKEIEKIDFSALEPNMQKAYLINVYNLLVINQIVEKWPVSSPMSIPGFFDGNKHNISGKQWTLNYLENEFMRPTYKDPRLHFVLVCGAKGCPPIINEAYLPQTLDTQLNRQTKIALNNPQFIRTADGNVQLSEIFKWYTGDFEKDGKKVIDFINIYRINKIDAKAKTSYYSYDWSVNTQAFAVSNDNNNAKTPIDPGFNLQTYNAGSLLKKGKFDVSLFNAMYTQNKSEWMGVTYSGFRETFVSSLLQITVGTTKSARINLGFDIKVGASGKSNSDSTFRSVNRAFGFQNNDSTRYGISQLGPRVKIQPFKNESNFTIQSSLLFPMTAFSEGRSDDAATLNKNEGLYFLEWDRINWWNQFFYVKSFNKSQLFLEADVWYRIGYKKEQASAVDLPVTVIYSYFPTPKTTVYGIASHTTRNQYNPKGYSDAITSAANYTAAGLGFKYQITPKINLELLYTKFLRGTNSGLGNTFNIGFRYVH